MANDTESEYKNWKWNASTQKKHKTYLLLYFL